MLHDQNGHGEIAGEKGKHVKGLWTASRYADGDHCRHDGEHLGLELARVHGLRRFPHAERKPPDECGRLDLGDQVLPDVNDIERGRRQLFGNIIKCAGTEGAEGDFRVFFGCGTDHNDGPAALSHDAAQSLDAIESRHLDIESDDIWIERRDFFQCLRSVACHSMT